MTYVNGKLLTQEYLDYLRAKEKFDGKFEVMNKLLSLIGNGMEPLNACSYILEEMKREDNELNIRSKYV